MSTSVTTCCSWLSSRGDAEDGAGGKEDEVSVGSAAVVVNSTLVGSRTRLTMAKEQKEQQWEETPDATTASEKAAAKRVKT